MKKRKITPYTIKNTFYMEVCNIFKTPIGLLTDGTRCSAYEIELNANDSDADSLTFKIPGDSPKLKWLVNENLILMDGEYYIIKKVSMEDRGDVVYTIEAEHEICSYKEKMNGKINMIGCTPKELITEVCTNVTEPYPIRFGGTDIVGKYRHLIADEESIFSNLVSIAQVFNARLKFVNIEGIIHIWLLEKPIDKGRFIEKGRDLNSVNLEYDSSEMYTILHYFGGTDPVTGNEITMHDENPTGKSYIEDFSYWTNQGYSLEAVKADHKCKKMLIIRNSELTTPKQVYEIALQEMSRICKPKLTATVDLIDLQQMPVYKLESIEIGDLVRVYDRVKNLNLEATVVGISKKSDDPLDISLNLSNVIEINSALKDLIGTSQVVDKITNGGNMVQGVYVNIGEKSLATELFEHKTQIIGNTTQINENKASIEANTRAIELKVSESQYIKDKEAINDRITESELKLEPDRITATVTQNKTFTSIINGVKDEVDTIADELENDINNIDNKINDLVFDVNGIFKDGIIDETETIILKNTLSQIEKESQELISRFNYVYNLPNLVNPHKSNLLNAKNIFLNKKNQLVNTINSISNDKKVTEDEKATYNTHVNEFTTALTNLNGSFDNCMEFVTDTKIDIELNKYKTQVDKEFEDVDKVISDTKEYIDGAFKDGILTESEKEGIKVQINQIQIEEKDIEKQYTAIYNHSLLINKATLKTAYDAYKSIGKQLIDFLNSILLLTNIEIGHVNEKNRLFTMYKEKKSAFAERLNLAIDEIAANRTNNLNTKVEEKFAKLDINLDEIKLSIGQNTTEITKTKESISEVTDNTNKIKTELKNDIKDVENSLSSLDSTMNGAFKDGVVNEAETKAINERLVQLDKEKTDLDVQYNAIITNIDLQGTAKTNITNAKNDFNSKYTDMKNYITSAISDKKVTEAEKTNINTKTKSYTTSLANLQKCFNEALDSISKIKADKAQTNANNHTNSEINKVVTTTNSKFSEIKATTDSISSKVSKVEEKTVTIDGKVTAHDKRIQNAEQKITPSAIVQSVTENFNNGGKVTTATMELNKNGLTTTSGSYKTSISNGVVTVRDKNSNNKTIELNNDIQIFNPTSGITSDFCGGIRRSISLDDNKKGLELTIDDGEDFLALSHITSGEGGIGDPSTYFVRMNRTGDVHIFRDVNFNNWNAKDIKINYKRSKETWMNDMYTYANQINVDYSSGNLCLNYWKGASAGTNSTKVYVNDGTNTGGRGVLYCKSVDSKAAVMQVQDTELGRKASYTQTALDDFIEDLYFGVVKEDGTCVIVYDHDFISQANLSMNYHVQATGYEGSSFKIERFSNHLKLSGGQANEEVSVVVKARTKSQEFVRYSNIDEDSELNNWGAEHLLKGVMNEKDEKENNLQYLFKNEMYKRAYLKEKTMLAYGNVIKEILNEN